MSGWSFDAGIVATKPISYTQIVRRFYYVRYARGTSRRLYIAVFIYGINDETKTNKIIDWATDSKAVLPFDPSILPKSVMSFNRVTSIMDFDINEKDQQPKGFNELESDFEFIRNDLEDDENPISLKHFEKYLATANYEKCICTMTNDEEARKKISEVVPTNTQG